MNAEKLLTVAMIVKNEEDNLRRCLDSIKDVADEIVAVDTGSTDGTVGILEEYGVKYIVSPWRDDFSFHRNESLDLAGGKWVFIIDADEEFFESGPGALRDFLKNADNLDDAIGELSVGTGSYKFDAISLNLFDMAGVAPVMSFNPARIFRRGKVRYEGIVHNQPTWGNSKTLFSPSGHLKHYGYDLSPEKMDAKYRRTLGLLEKRVAVDPEDYHAYFYLVQTLLSMGRDDDALKSGLVYLASREKDPDFNGTAYYYVYQILASKKRFKEAGDILKQGLDELGDDLDLCYASIEYGVETGKPDVVVQGARRFLYVYDRMQAEPFLRGNRFTFTLRPENRLTALYNLAFIQMNEGMVNLSKIPAALAQANPEFSVKIETDLERELKKIGIHWVNNPNQGGLGNGGEIGKHGNNGNGKSRIIQPGQF